ncbi:hypothetical protein JYU14_04270 [Simkania negevensis]|uniref:Cell shape-determining protein MreC n=1 Tax=Simkania negevensis TaxID=83561 RepID=A0ABS3ARW0_9BACT|nr:hypothetical protein [Simkania negevensis]
MSYKKKWKIAPYLVVVVLLFSLLSMPKGVVEDGRGAAAWVAAPFWKALYKIKMGGIPYFPFLSFFKKTSRKSFSKELGQLQTENFQLQAKLREYERLIVFYQDANRTVELRGALSAEAGIPKEMIKRRYEELESFLQSASKALIGRVIYRDPAAWSSYVWINLGEKDNRGLASPVVVKNSPVILNNAVVGVIDEVGDVQSRVQLITGSKLRLSVRVVRGGPENILLLKQIDSIQQALETRKDLFHDLDAASLIRQDFENLRGLILSQTEEIYLAKGELAGVSRPAWRSRGTLLKGYGFNYDSDDEEGLARNLVTGEYFIRGGEGQPLIQGGDLLVTTGFDGHFPSGLLVARVVKVHPLKEGAFAYDIDAKPVIDLLHDIEHLFVIPPNVLSEGLLHQSPLSHRDP